MGLLNGFAASQKPAQQQRQQRRELFLADHSADTPPLQLQAARPRKLRYELVLYLLLFSLLGGPWMFGRLVYPCLKTLEANQRETQQWVRNLTSTSLVSERDVRHQKLAAEIERSEEGATRELRWTILLAAIVPAMLLIAFPMLGAWVILDLYFMLRNGAVARAELVSRKRWTSSARLSFTTADGRRIETFQTVPLFVPIGTKLWVLYSQRNPKRALVYNSRMK